MNDWTQSNVAVRDKTKFCKLRATEHGATFPSEHFYWHTINCQSSGKLKEETPSRLFIKTQQAMAAICSVKYYPFAMTLDTFTWPFPHLHSTGAKRWSTRAALSRGPRWASTKRLHSSITLHSQRQCCGISPLSECSLNSWFQLPNQEAGAPLPDMADLRQLPLTLCCLLPRTCQVKSEHSQKGEQKPTSTTAWPPL